MEARSLAAPFKRRIAIAAILLMTVFFKRAACGGGEEEEESATPGLTGIAAPTGTAAHEGVMKATASINQWRSEMMVEGATITMTDTDRRAIEMGPMEQVVVENGKARWEYFGPLWDFNEE